MTAMHFSAINAAVRCLKLRLTHKAEILSISKIRNIQKVELLAYHTMAVNKYGKLGIVYRLKGVPPMDKGRLDELKKLVRIPENKHE